MLTEGEILDRFEQALGEADRACQTLERNADEEYLALRGMHYAALKRALGQLEGCARQMAAWRSDTRWLRVGVLYARITRSIQQKFVAQQWKWFGAVRPAFERGRKEMDILRHGRVGKVGAILPENPSSWLIMPERPPLLTMPPPFSQTRH